MIETRWYQQEAKESLFKYFAEHSGNPVIALPTGTGKSVVIADFISEVLSQFPGQRILMATHVKELIRQNAEKLLKLWPIAPLGIYSAGLNQKDASMPIVFGGIATIAGNVGALGHRDLLIVDEAHLISPNANTMYGKTFAALKEINPKIKAIGLTATPFRLGQGLITEDGLFTDICYDLTNIEGFSRLVNEGFLAPLVPKKTQTVIDLSSVGVLSGEYKQNELQHAVDREKITFGALKELVAYSADRVCGLIFATGIEHAEHINDMLQRAFGQSSVVIHSKKGKGENDLAMSRWKTGAVKWAVSMNSLTTGVDNPMIDIIGMLRPTLSPSLWVQMLGRGTRPSLQTNKRDCLVLDFAGNTKRLGPINDPRIPRKRGKATGEIPVKICAKCDCYNHISARVCIGCGEPFDFEIKIKEAAASDELMRNIVADIRVIDVDYVIYNRHQKEAAPASIRVSYFCGKHKYDEWVSFDREGYPRKKALDWLRQRIDVSTVDVDSITTDSVLANRAFLRAPKRVRVWVNKTYPEVMGYEY